MQCPWCVFEARVCRDCLAGRLKRAEALLVRCEEAVRLCVTTRNQPSLATMHALAEDLAPYRAKGEG